MKVALMAKNSVWSEQELDEQLLDDYIQLALFDWSEIEGSCILKENEKLKMQSNYNDVDVSKQIQKLFGKTKRQDNVKIFFINFYKRVAPLAVAFFFVFLCVTTAFASNEEFRHIVYRLIFREEIRYTEIVAYENNLAFHDPDIYTWNHIYAPTYIPSGFILEDYFDTENIFQVFYHNDNDQYIEILQSQNGLIRADNENLIKKEYISINDSEAILIVNTDESITLIWQVGSMLMTIYSDIDETEVILIAEGIKPLR